MTTRLHIVITCTRRENLPRIIHHYLSEMEPHPFELRIHIMVQGPDADAYGIKKCNEAMDMIPDGWMFFFADDTFQHPALFRRLGEIVSENPTAGCVMFAEDRGNGVFRPSDDNSREGFICGGMMAVSREFVGCLRFDTEQPLHRTDGRFIACLYARGHDRFVHINEVLTKENSLQWV